MTDLSHQPGSGLTDAPANTTPRDVLVEQLAKEPMVLELARRAQWVPTAASAGHALDPHFVPKVGSEAVRADGEPQALLNELAILMVNDALLLTDLLRTHLEEAGYQHLITVKDPAQALAAARRCHPSLVLLDLQMPTASGFEVLEAMRRDEDLRHVPVIVLTDPGEPSIKLKALAMGATDFLAKPVDPTELVLRVRNSLVLKVYQERLANSDPITGLPNRRVLTDRLRTSLERAQAQTQRLAVLHVSLDRFGKVASSLGHSAADHLLSRVARRLKGCVRRDDDDVRHGRVESVLVTRLDNDAFLVLLPEIETPEGAARVARRILFSLARPFRIGMDDVVINPCVGISVFPDDGATPDSLVGHAVAATEHAQTMGRNTYRFHSKAFNQATIERLKLEAHLRRASERGELHIAYQPKVDNRTGRIVGAEALLRWRHGELGPIGPDRFMPIAEETGLIVALGHWVLDQACAQLRRWSDDGLGHLKVAVNVSRQELQAGGVVQAIEDALGRHRLQGSSLILELTESVLVDRLEATSQQLEQIRRLGVQVSIDDFGTGSSSMNYVKHFPLDELKIDRSFVNGLPQDMTDMAIVRAMVVLGQSLGMRIVAEGIEDPEQLTAVQSLGIDQSQGFLLGRPLAPAELAGLARVFELRPQTLPGGLAPG